MIDAYILWHEKDDDRGDVPVGYVSFGPPSLASTNRRETFGKHFDAAVVNKWFSTVTRVVLDPRYRGAGIASTMLRDACTHHAERKSIKYIEAKTSMGAVNRFNQAAGFRLMGTNSQLEQTTGGNGRGAGGGAIGESKRDKSREIRQIYEFVMDTEDELGVDIT